ncbi:MAG: hypothetical protein ABSF09_06415 [Candidatus Bathyarchaeia archaeon]
MLTLVRIDRAQSRIWDRIMKLPMFPDLTEEQEYVIEAIRSFPAGKYW